MMQTLAENSAFGRDTIVSGAPITYSVEETLRDGKRICIRSIQASDKQLLLDHFHTLSPEARYFRFFGIRSELDAEELKRFTELDFSDRVGLAATDIEGNRERFIGVGRYVRSAAEPWRGEVAFAVLDEFQGHGVGTLLLEHLAKIAVANGIRQFSATVMGSNYKMLEVFENSGFTIHEKNQDGAVSVSILLQ